MTLCPRCATPNPSDYAFCDVCGARFGDAAAGTAGGQAVSPARERQTIVQPVAAPVAAAIASAAPESSASVSTLAPASAAAETRPAATAALAADPAPSTNGAAVVAEPRKPRLTERQARWLALAGVALAAFGEGYLQLAFPSNRNRATGLICLIVAAILFGVGARVSFLSVSSLCPRLQPFLPRAVFQPGPPLIAAGVGLLAFVVLMGRLIFGSTVATDLLLWFVAIAAFAMPIVGELVLRAPARSTLLEIAGVAAICLAFILLAARDINFWYYSAIGDEYSFLSSAQGVFNEGIKRPFAQDGVYGAHPVLGVLFQAAVMAVFGRNHFGWIMSSILSAALAIPAIYLIGRFMAGRVVGLIAAALFASCHYIFAFSHIGYNNIMAPTPISWAIAFFLLGLRRTNPWPLYASGLAAGLGFYTFYSARVTVPILALFVLIQYGWRACLTPRGLKDRLFELWPLILGFVLAAAPIFGASGTAVITRMFNEVPGGYNADVTGPPGQKILVNFWLNVPAFFHNTHVAHYVSGSLLDPVTAALVALGLGLAIRWWSNPACKLLLIWTGVAIGVTALLSPHPTTAVTRLMFDVPPLCVLAAFAARQIWQIASMQLQPTGWLVAPPRRNLVAGCAVATLLVVVLALNLQRFWVTTPNTMHLAQDAVVIGALRSNLCGPESNRAIVVMRGTVLIRGALASYIPERDLPKLIAHSDLKPDEPIQFGDARCVVFGDPNDEPAKRAIEALTKANPGAEATPFRDFVGIGTVQVVRPADGAARR